MKIKHFKSDLLTGKYSLTMTLVPLYSSLDFSGSWEIDTSFHSGSGDWSGETTELAPSSVFALISSV